VGPDLRTWAYMWAPGHTKSLFSNHFSAHPAHPTPPDPWRSGPLRGRSFSLDSGARGRYRLGALNRREVP